MKPEMKPKRNFQETPHERLKYQKCSNHANERLKCQNVANTMQTMPKCSKYNAKWQILVPNSCEYTADGTRKESQQKIQSLSQKKLQKLFCTLSNGDSNNCSLISYPHFVYTLLGQGPTVQLNCLANDGAGLVACGSTLVYLARVTLTWAVDFGHSTRLAIFHGSLANGKRRWLHAEFVPFYWLVSSSWEIILLVPNRIFPAATCCTNDEGMTTSRPWVTWIGDFSTFPKQPILCWGNGHMARACMISDSEDKL